MNNNQRIFLAGVIGVIIFTSPLCFFSNVSGLLVASCISALAATLAVTTAFFLASNRKIDMFVTTAGLLLVVCKYAVCNVFFSIVMLALSYSGKWTVPLTVFILFHITLAGITGWKLLAADTGKEEIECVENKLIESICDWKILSLKVNNIPLPSDPVAARNIKNVQDSIRYASPVSSAALKAIEENINNNVCELDTAVGQSDLEKINTLTQTILQQINRRSEMSKLLK